MILKHIRSKSPWWSWSYGSWSYNYLCNQCLSLLMSKIRIPLMARCTRNSILSVTSNRSAIFPGYSSFLHQ